MTEWGKGKGRDREGGSLCPRGWKAACARARQGAGRKGGEMIPFLLDPGSFPVKAVAGSKGMYVSYAIFIKCFYVLEVV